jgi:predicted PhzF superfamily epimerase YddE/YHI9
VTSHTAFIDTSTPDTPTVRFFTSVGELTNCGHGIIAAQAVLLHRSGATEHHGRQRSGGRIFAATAVRRRDGVEVWFDQGVIALADDADAISGGIIAALGLQRADIATDVRVASPGTPRLLVPVRDHRTLLSMRPDFDRRSGRPRPASDSRSVSGASAGESEAGQRRDRHGADADQRRGGAGAAVGEEVTGAGARGVSSTLCS